MGMCVLGQTMVLQEQICLRNPGRSYCLCKFRVSSGTCQMLRRASEEKDKVPAVLCPKSALVGTGPFQQQPPED